MAIRIIVADDHKIFREGLINLLSASDNIEIIDQAENGKQAIEKSEILKPDILIMDIGMPIVNGIEATKILQQKKSGIKVIGLTMHAEKHFIKGMFDAGAYGYLFKNCSYEELMDAITIVHNGKKYVSDKITEILIDNYLGKPSMEGKDANLSIRETEVLKLIAEGKTSKEISELLFVSIKTVGTHRKNILDKLGLNSTADMVKYAIKNEIITNW